MRNLILLLVTLTVAALPVAASAQDPEGSGSRVERWHPDAYVAPDASEETKPQWPPAPDPWLRLHLDDTGFQSTPAWIVTAEQLEAEREAQKRRVRIGVSVAVVGAVVITGIGLGAAVASLSRSFE